MPVQHDLVAFGFEAGRSQPLEVPRAVFNLKDLAADRAMKMVVMVLPCHLVAWGFAGELNGRDLFFLE